MNIVVLAGGLSTERDVSFKTGDMVSKALRENGHNVILLDVFMGYSDKEEDLTGIFDRTGHFHEEREPQRFRKRTWLKAAMCCKTMLWRFQYWCYDRAHGR